MGKHRDENTPPPSHEGNPPVAFVDLRYIVWCPDCIVHELARTGLEGTATRYAERHHDAHPSHTRATVRHIPTEDVKTDLL